jgi:hypothetical protein
MNRTIKLIQMVVDMDPKKRLFLFSVITILTTGWFVYDLKTNYLSLYNRSSLINKEPIDIKYVYFVKENKVEKAMATGNEEQIDALKLYYKTDGIYEIPRNMIFHDYDINSEVKVLKYYEKDSLAIILFLNTIPRAIPRVVQVISIKTLHDKPFNLEN